MDWYHQAGMMTRQLPILNDDTANSTPAQGTGMPRRTGLLKRCRNGMNLSKRSDLLLLIAGLGFIAFNRGRTGFILLGILLFGAGVFLSLRTPAGTGVAPGFPASGEEHGWMGAFRFLLGIIGECIGIMILGMM